jgi:fructose-1-phosphate kinase PfkB-like protein
VAALVAGLVWGLSKALAPEDTLRWGAACGAAAASHAGTAFGSYDDVAHLAEQVTVREVFQAEQV